MLSNDMGKLYRVVMHHSYWPQNAHKDLKEHLTTDGIDRYNGEDYSLRTPPSPNQYDDKTLCGLTIGYRQWEVVIGANEEIDLLNKCKKCLKIKEKYNAEVY